jgi:hypothetical protein
LRIPCSDKVGISGNDATPLDALTTLTGVNDADYKPPFPLSAKLNKLTIKLDRPQLSPEEIKKLQAAMREKAKSE